MKVKRSTLYAIFAVLALAFLLAVLIVGCKKLKNQNQPTGAEQDTVSLEDVTLPFDEEFSPFDSVSTDVDTSQKDKVMTVDTNTNKITPVSDQVVEENPGKIYIIVGSFRVYKNALKTKAYYERLGYNPQILPQVAGFNRVAIESFTDLKKARKRLEELRKKFNRPDFWLLYKK